MTDPGRSRRPSGTVLRARRLLAGGAAGGAAALAVAVAVFGLVAAARGALSALVAGLVTLGFFAVGQGVQVLVADAAPVQVLLAALLSYLVRVIGLGVLLWFALADPARSAAIDAQAVVFTTIGVVVGWLAAQLWVFSRLRIPVFDPPSE